MPNFSTNMNEWGGGYAAPSTVNKKDSSGGLVEMLAKLIPGALDAVGTGYARAQGLNVVGGNTTAVEAQEAVTAFDEVAPFSQDESNTPDQRAIVDDMRNAALKKFGTDDKKIQALVSAGKISTVEANARRHQMLQENLSNPVLAMFKEDFLDASTAFTGGQGLSEKYFGAYLPTEEEQVQNKMIEETIKNRVDFEGKVQQVSQIYGISPEAAAKQIKLRAEQDDFLKQKEAEHKLRTFSSAESYTVAMAHVDRISGEITANLAAMVSSGKKFDDPATIIGQLEQARAVGMAQVAKYASTMTVDDRNSATAALNKRIDQMKDMVNSADGHDYFMRSVARIKGGVEANEAKATQIAMDAVGGPMWAIHKYSPALGEVIMNASAGDKAAEFKLATDPYGQSIMKKLGISVGEKDVIKVGEKIAEGRTDFNVRDALAAVLAIFTGDASGIKAEVEVANKNPDTHTALLQAQFKATPDENYLSKYNSSRDWIVKARTPDGAKTVANAVAARVSQARAMQIRTGDIPTGKIVVREAPYNPQEAPGRSVMYEFHTPGIDPTVQKDMIEVIKIIRNSPLVAKELGVNNAEEYLQKFFLKP